MGSSMNYGFGDLTRNFMWQSPNSRTRAQQNARKRERDRNRMPFHIKRVAIKITLQVPGADPVVIDARTLLNDLSSGGMGLFSAHKFNADDEVVVTFESPKKIEIKARIAWCQEYFVVGKVLKSQSFSYRAGLQFKYASPEEEKAVQEFCDELLNKHHCPNLSAA